MVFRARAGPGKVKEPWLRIEHPSCSLVLVRGMESEPQREGVLSGKKREKWGE
jgi:hypothetical protein